MLPLPNVMTGLLIGDAVRSPSIVILICIATSTSFGFWKGHCLGKKIEDHFYEYEIILGCLKSVSVALLVILLKSCSSP